MPGGLGVPVVQEGQEVLADPLGLLRRPDLLDPVVLRRQDRLCRPLLLRGREVLEAPETSRNHPIRASSRKPQTIKFFA